MLLFFNVLFQGCEELNQCCLVKPRVNRAITKRLALYVRQVTQLCLFQPFAHETTPHQRRLTRNTKLQRQDRVDIPEYPNLF